MTDYKEEQEGELEALRCIYPEEELKVISEDPYCFEIKVAVEDSENEGSQLTVVIQFSLPASYPDEIPEVTVTMGTGLEVQQMRELERNITEQATENIGAVMVFTLVYAVQELLAAIMDREREEREREKQMKEEEEKKLEEAKYRGTSVTVESFKEWRTTFDEERRREVEKAGKGKEGAATTSRRLTGRQMFEHDATLVLSDAKFFTEGDMESGQAEVEVDESLFQDMDDLALDLDT